MAASVRIEDEAFGDERYADLAAAAGLADADHARGKMARLWRQCTIEQTYFLSRETVQRVLGDRGVEALIIGRLGEDSEHGIRIRGTRGRIEWLKKVRDNGKFGKKGGRPRKNPGGLSDTKPRRVSKNTNPETPPAPAPAPAPAPPDPEKNLPPAGAHAIPPTPKDGGQPGSRQPGPRATQQGAATPGQGASSAAGNVAEPQPSVGTLEPRSSWHDRQRWWRAMLEASARLRAAGIEPNAPKLPEVCAGENEKNVARCARHFADSGFDEPAVDAKMKHVVAVAEAEATREGHRRWFKPALIWDPERAARAGDTSLEEARRSRRQAGKSDPHSNAPTPSELRALTGATAIPTTNLVTDASEFRAQLARELGEDTNTDEDQP